MLLIRGGIELNPGPHSPACGYCQKLISKGNNLTLACKFCDKFIYLHCVVKEHVKHNGHSLKNSHDWLHEFISSASLSFICNSCSTRLPTRHCISLVDIGSQTSSDLRTADVAVQSDVVECSESHTHHQETQTSSDN
jgi:hypothetical protein